MTTMMIAKPINYVMPNEAKPEKVDDEIDMLAKRIKLVNESKMKHMNSLTYNTFPLNPPPIVQVSQDLSEDKASVLGQFGWAEIESENIPYLLRSGEKYVSERMVQTKLPVRLMEVFSSEVYDCYKIVKIKVTKAEANLLNEINIRHCDCSYGQTIFNMNEYLIKLSDIIEQHAFLNFCYDRIIKRCISKNSRCGFVKIGSQNYVPYILVGNKQCVPLFYFEGECWYLEEKSTNLTGWDLTYLKLVCKVQGIRKELFDNEKIQVVEVDVIKQFLYSDTTFTEFWPTENNVAHLVKTMVSHKVQCSGMITDTRNYNNVKTYSIQRNRHVGYAAPAPTPSPNYDMTNGVTHTNPYSAAHTSSPTGIHGKPYGMPYATAPNSTALPTMASRTAPTVTNTTASGTFVQIPEIPSHINQELYFIYKVQIEYKMMEYCINMEPLSNSTLLITLEELALNFFKTPIPIVFNALVVMGLNIYMPNKHQLALLAKYNFKGTKGLILVDSLREHLPQIKFILTSR